MANNVPLDPAQHGNLRARLRPDFAKAEGQQVLPVTVFEFSRAGADCPIVFVKNADTGQFQAVVLLGLTQGENLLLSKGEWLGTYLPEVLRVGPFRLLMPEGGAEAGNLGIELDSPMVSETEGEALFDASGEPTEFLVNCGKMVEDYYKQSQITAGFLSLLVERDLLTMQSLKMDIEGVKVQIDGIYLVDEQKVRELPDEVVVDYHKRGFLQAIHAHQMSLRQTARLAKMKLIASRGNAGSSIRGL